MRLKLPGETLSAFGVAPSAFPTALHPDMLLTVRQMAAFSNVSESSVEGWIRRGELPVVRLSPRRIGIRLGDISAFIQSRRQSRPAA